jgi:alkanesulfonate monooxygenase SsuD/methylene tetrahydromethanopterin reductase-like flavin-dependent oxidoreductase (luciferase family)
MGTMTMRIGVVLPIAQEDGMDGTPSYREIREIAVGAEAAGFDSIWVYDHLLFRFDGETTGIHECWTILAAVAEATHDVHLGALVMCTEFRNPAILAKMAATLDHLSDSRLILGIGCGWHDPEYEAFGYPTDHKVGRFEDSLTIIRSLIRDGRADHQGRFHSATDAVLVPPARPDLPILIAAKRPRMLDLTAAHADAWNLAWFGLPTARLTTTRADLEAACARIGRDPSTLAVTIGVEVRYGDLPGVSPNEGGMSGAPLGGGAEEVAAAFATYEALGAEHLIVALDPTTPAGVARLAEALDHYRRQRVLATNAE